MVKNTFGGNKHKGQARKTILSGKQSTKLRVAKEDGEMYAQVIKILGGPVCSVTCIIRGKFRSKRDNFVKTGTWVLVGLRSWMSEKEGGGICDLLEVYADTDKERLKTQEHSVDWNIFVDTTRIRTQEEEDAVIFSNIETHEEYEELISSELNSKPISFEKAEDMMINVDDI